MPEPSSELREFVPYVELEDLSFLELTARRISDATSTAAEVEPRYTLNAQISGDLLQFRLVLRIDLETDVGEVRAAAVGTYRVGDEAAGTPTQRLVVEYANEVAVMALLPYLRHAIADLTLRVFGSALLMPVMQRGAVRFPLPD